MNSIIENYVEYASEFTDSPPVLHHRIAMSLISTVVNRNVWLTQGFKKTYPNLWTLIIAPSSFYRKSYSIAIGEDILRQVRPELILPKEFSHEKLVEVLAAQPQGILIFYEFKTFIGLMSKDYMMGAKSFITEIFDCPEYYDRKLKSVEYKIFNPFLNILSASTLDWLKSSLKDEDIAGGFLPRFLLVIAPKKEKIISFQPPASQVKRQRLIEKFKELEKVTGEITFSKDAINFYDGWYKEHEKKHENSAEFSPFFTRLQDYAKKLAIILTIDKNKSFQINEEICRTACALTDSYSRNLLQIMDSGYSNNRSEKNLEKISNFIKRSGKDGISREKLYRKSKMIARDLEQILHTLEQSENIEIEKISINHPTGEKLKLVYKWIEN